MKYVVAALITLISIPALSCGSDTSDTAEQELEVEVPSRMDVFLAENGFESVNTANERGELPLQHSPIFRKITSSKVYSGPKEVIRSLS